jgi:hypothetical protein
MRKKLLLAASRRQPCALGITAPSIVVPVPQAGRGRRALRALWRRNEVTGRLEMRWELTDEPAWRRSARRRASAA